MNLPLFRALAPVVLLSVTLPVSLVGLPGPALAQETPAEMETADVGDRLAQANRLFQQGVQQNEVSQFRAALQSWQQALELYRDAAVKAAFPQESRQGEGSALGSLGNAYRNLGQYQQAIDFYEQSLVIFRELGDRLGEGNALVSDVQHFSHSEGCFSECSWGRKGGSLVI